MNKFKVGDRVMYLNKGDIFHGQCGIVQFAPYDNGESYIYEVRLENGHKICEKEECFATTVCPTPKTNINTEYNIKCIKWFNSAYAAITKAGGRPDFVIDSIPVDVLENLIRNDLHLEYKK